MPLITTANFQRSESYNVLMGWESEKIGRMLKKLALWPGPWRPEKFSVKTLSGSESIKYIF